MTQTKKSPTSNFTMITNNPMVAEKYPTVTDYFACSLCDILVKGRDAIHLGSRLINHPLYGSIKPTETPYRTLMLSDQRGNLDMMSLRLIEGSFDVLRKLPKKDIAYTESMLEDFQVVDLDLIDSAIRALPADYHF